jgi:hypothetical protein
MPGVVGHVGARSLELRCCLSFAGRERKDDGLIQKVGDGDGVGENLGNGICVRVGEYCNKQNTQYDKK